MKKSKSNVQSKDKKMTSAKKPKLRKIFTEELPDDEIVNLDSSGEAANEDDRLSSNMPVTRNLFGSPGEVK